MTHKGKPALLVQKIRLQKRFKGTLCQIQGVFFSVLNPVTTKCCVALILTLDKYNTKQLVLTDNIACLR